MDEEEPYSFLEFLKLFDKLACDMQDHNKELMGL